MKRSIIYINLNKKISLDFFFLAINNKHMNKKKVNIFFSKYTFFFNFIDEIVFEFSWLNSNASRPIKFLHQKKVNLRDSCIYIRVDDDIFAKRHYFLLECIARFCLRVKFRCCLN